MYNGEGSVYTFMKKWLPFKKLSSSDIFVYSKLLRFDDTCKVISKHKKLLLKTPFQLLLWIYPLFTSITFYSKIAFS